MRSVSILATAFAFGAGTFVMTRDAHALGPVGVEVGAKVGLGTNPSSESNAPNSLGFGLGARGGVTIMGFYGGVQFMYYLGSSSDASGPNASASASVHTVMYGLEAGYGFNVADLVTIRPQLGLGNATFSGGETVAVGNGVGENVSASTSNLYLEPGVTALVGLGLWYVGADANVLFFPGLDGSKAAFTLHGQVGVQF